MQVLIILWEKSIFGSPKYTSLKLLIWVNSSSSNWNCFNQETWKWFIWKVGYSAINLFMFSELGCGDDFVKTTFPPRSRKHAKQPRWAESQRAAKSTFRIGHYAKKWTIKRDGGMGTWKTRAAWLHRLPSAIQCILITKNLLVWSEKSYLTFAWWSVW